MRAMLRHQDEAMLVEAKAVDAAYPLYGTLEVENTTLAAALANATAYMGGGEQGLLDRLDLERRDCKIGRYCPALERVIKEPDRNAGGFPLAPRLMVRHETLKAAGLLRPGALINYHYRLRLPDNADNGAVKAVVGATQERFPLAGWRLRDRSDASPSMRRFIERLGLFLTLVGLTALVVGGVGVGNAIHAYLQRRRETIAVLKALGASGRFIFRIYAVQIGFLSVLALLSALGGRRRSW